MTGAVAAPAPERPVIELAGVTKVYEMGVNSVVALRGIDLTVRARELIAIMGSSGSGKSTLMNVLGCLDVPTEGQYKLDGVRVDGLNRNALADLRNQKLGFVFQGFNLLARTSALENVELPLLYDRQHRWPDPERLATDALRRVGLGERLEHQPNELSGGQQQRVAIARALVTQPTLLLADEPTGNLDSHTTVDVMALFQELNKSPKSLTQSLEPKLWDLSIITAPSGATRRLLWQTEHVGALKSTPNFHGTLLKSQVLPFDE